MAGRLLPPRLAARKRLAYVAEHFDTVEVNGSFYALQRPTTYQRWYDETPDGFRFALKGGRFITHLKRLRDVRQGLANFFASGPLVLADKLGPVLWQLPASITFDVSLITDFLAQLPRTTSEAADLAAGHDERLRGRAAPQATVDLPVRHALEVRHRSFDDPRFFERWPTTAWPASSPTARPGRCSTADDRLLLRPSARTFALNQRLQRGLTRPLGRSVRAVGRRRSRPRLLRQRRQGSGAPRRRRTRPSPPPAVVGRLTTGVRPGPAGGRRALRSRRRPR